MQACNQNRVVFAVARRGTGASVKSVVFTINHELPITLANGMYLCKVLMQNASQTQFVWKLRIEQ